jgi:chromate transporter
MGIQSFGGGSSTFLIMRQTCLKRGWFSEEEFTRNWALAQIAPGINLVKMTVMCGYQLCGWPGLLAAASGLLMPSAAVTVLMTAGFAQIRSQPLVQAALRGVLPAAIGLSFAMSIQMAAPLLTQAKRESPQRLGAHILILASAALLMAVYKLSPVLILLSSGLVGALLLAVLPTPLPQEREEG